MTYDLTESIALSASPEQVYALVSDITRTGEWSEQTVRAEWDSSARGVGATFTGHNRTAEREWSTVSTVVVAETGREFVWEVGGGRAVWGYRIEPRGDGSLLTLFTSTSEVTKQFFEGKYGEDAHDQLALRQNAARAGIPRTLARIAEILG